MTPGACNIAPSVIIIIFLTNETMQTRKLHWNGTCHTMADVTGCDPALCNELEHNTTIRVHHHSTTLEMLVKMMATRLSRGFFF
jgi:hypothetical protein